VTNRQGTVIAYYRDPLKQQAAIKQNGITITNALDASGRVLKTIRIGSDDSQIVQSKYGYDILGNQIASTNALGQSTTYSEIITNYQRLRSTTFPDGSTRIELFYRDGQLAKITGTAVHPVRYEYGTEQDGSIWRLFTKEIKLDANGNDTSEWTKTYKDMLGRSYKSVFSDGATRESFYNTKGQLVKQIDPDGVITLYAYNAKGEQTVVATDTDRDGVIDYDGTDRIRQTVSTTANVSSQDVRQTKSYAWATNNSAVSNLVSESRASTDGLQSWTIHQSQLTNHSRTKYAGGGNRYATNTAPDGSISISSYANGLLQSVTRKDSAGTQLSQVSYFYDAHGRQYASTDARNGTSYLTYNDADRVVSTITPAPGNGQSPQTTSYEHDWAGRVTRAVLPDGTSVTNEYHLTGELKKTYGSRNYPVQYGYDAQGRRTNMITWKNFAADSGKATTTWKYDTNRGFRISKAYDDGKGTTNTYTPAGRLRTRTWARGVVTTYHTNSLGEIFATTYSDTTSAVTNNFDRLGRSTNIIDGAGSRFLVYNSTGQLLGETNSSGTLIGANLRFAYDQYFRRTNHAWYATNTSLLSHSFVFDGASRITNVSDGTYQGAYSYLANSPLISQINYRSNSTTRMTTARTYDFLNRLSSISSQPSASGLSPLAYTYSYNDGNQRVRVNMADGSFWIYEYDRLGQIISGKRYWSDWTPVAGQQYEYAFDDIGNRSSTKSGGDSSGASLRLASYTANSLNQYSSRDAPAYLNVLGIAHE
jgi:YD repeat-containing protein